MYHLNNLKALRDNMREKEIGVLPIPFAYKNTHYYLNVCLLTEEDRVKQDAKYALVKLCFIKASNLDDYLICYANSKDLIIDTTKLRKFLKVPFQKDGFNWREKFLSLLGQRIPTTASIEKQHEAIALKVICINENRNSEKTFRYSLIRNGKTPNGEQKHRTEYNGQLASYKFPKLYPKFKDDKTISFGFTDSIEKEKTEEEIFKNFTKTC